MGILPVLTAINREKNNKVISALVATDGAFSVSTDGRGGSLYSSIWRYKDPRHASSLRVEDPLP